MDNKSYVAFAIGEYADERPELVMTFDKKYDYSRFRSVKVYEGAKYRDKAQELYNNLKKKYDAKYTK